MLKLWVIRYVNIIQLPLMKGFLQSHGHACTYTYRSTSPKKHHKEEKKSIKCTVHFWEKCHACEQIHQARHNSHTHVKFASTASFDVRQKQCSKFVQKCVDKLDAPFTCRRSCCYVFNLIATWKHWLYLIYNAQKTHRSSSFISKSSTKVRLHVWVDEIIQSFSYSDCYLLEAAPEWLCFWLYFCLSVTQFDDLLFPISKGRKQNKNKHNYV